jgi:superfamily II DNA or RNA helicase
MKKSNRQLNEQYDERMKARVHPHPKDYQWQALEQVIKQWGTQNEKDVSRTSLA